MPLNSEATSTQSRHDFCLALKAARERQGISLAEIADTTKIAASHFADLERNDLSHWPKGLFRRSFFRDYARMIGMPVDEACAEFVRLFPDEENAPAAEPAAPSDAAKPADDARLAFDEGWHGARPSGRSRVLAAAIDVGAVAVAAAVLAWLAPTSLSTTTALVAIAYFSVGTTVLGSSPGARALSTRWSLLDALLHAPANLGAAWKHGTYAVTQMFDRAGEQPAAQIEKPRERAWVSDARRVGPPTRLRVRIKLPH